MNEVAAVTRRLIGALLGPSDNCPKQIIRLFSGKGMQLLDGLCHRCNVQSSLLMSSAPISAMLTPNCSAIASWIEFC
jgi:hypothetical protein